MTQVYFRYTLLGFCFGLLFPIFALVADCFLFNDLQFNWSTVFNRIEQNPIHFVILSAPIVLGFAAFQIGKSIVAQKAITKKLERSNKAIIHTNELLDDFNYHVSHDLKTILNNQLTLSSMLAKYVEQNNAEKIIEITNRLQQVGQSGISTVMNFLKISELGLLDYDHTEANIEHNIKQILYENNLESAVEVSVRKREFATLAIGDKLLQSILLNLLTNSIKYTINPPKVTIDLIRNGNEKKIIYSDNGIGIDLVTNGSELFKPFKRIENGLAKEGTGVGLYLIKKMIIALDGEIEIESKLGQGTLFTITFYSDSTRS